MNRRHSSGRNLLAPAAFAALICAAAVLLPAPVRAGTTGTISGVVTAPNGRPLAGAAITATSPSQKATATSDAHGFYSFVALLPDTYTLSFTLRGYGPTSVPGVVVLQDQNVAVNQTLVSSLSTIAHVQTTAGGTLVKPNQGSDVYNVSGQELNAVTNPGDLHETLYQWTAIVPGVTSTGFPAQPRIRGGQVTDLGYEFEGIPIQDDIVGFFTTNLSNIGVQNLEVETGGLSAADAANGTGFLNSVARVGTYPGFTNLAVDLTGPDYNHYLTFQTGYATPNHRYSYYVGFDGVGSLNQYVNGRYTFPGVLEWSADGPGPVQTRDWIGNFHYKPDPNDDIQFLITNSYGDFDFNYLINSTSQPPALQFEPCPGAVPSGSSPFTGATGGFAPNGQSCPLGLYWGALPTGKGNIWYHYGGLGKIQWNHTLDDHSFFTVRLAENFNEYIFDQPIGDANIPAFENVTGVNGWNWAWWLGTPGQCPTIPMAAGTPVVSPASDPFDICAFDDGTQNFWGDRRSEIYLGSFDYQNLINDNITVKSGVSYTRSYNVFNYYLTNAFTNLPYEFTWPQVYEISTFPTDETHVYAEGDFHYGKWLLEPGMLYAARRYAFPNGGATVAIWNPTFNGTYQFDSRDVLRFSYGDTSSFIGTAYVYLRPDSLISRNPLEPGASFSPQLNHMADVMWEHQFDAETSMRIGPWIEKTSNYYESYRPIIGYTPTTPPIPIFSPHSILSNNQQHHDFGVEFELQHVDNRPIGLSFWLTATYDNYWTSSTALAGAFINSPEPQNLINEGHLLRAVANPLWNTAFLFDFHDQGFHLDPLVIYQTDYFFYANPGLSFPTCGGTCAPYISGHQHIASAFWNVNLLAYQEIGPKKNFFVGFKIDNLTNNYDNANLVPCSSTFGTGCFPYFNGPYSGVSDKPGSLIYQNFTQSPREYEFLAGVRIGDTSQ
ncbi:MAG TPA: TonB-dependent receptor [Candidatus Tyrphobacter sp.]